jgi:hypothetical protein
MEKTIKVKDPTGKTIGGLLIYPQSPPWYLEFKTPGGIHEKVEGRDLFDCFQKIRRMHNDYLFLCHGSRINVFPSRMSRQMSGGLQAYAMTKGKQASQNDLVNIFDFSESNQFGTPEEQDLFFKEWLQALQVKNQ